MKRLTAVLLIVCLLASMCSVGVWADDESAMPETENSQGESTVIQETEEPDTEQDAESVEAEEEASAEETVETEEEASTEEEAPAEQTDTAASETPEAETTEAEDADEAAETIVEAAGEEAATLGSAAQTNTLSVTYINPLYADVITEDDLVQPAEAADVPSVVSEDDEYVSTSEAAVQMRASLVSRVETITVKYTADEYAQEDVSSIYSQALEHTGTPTEGDYLKWQTGGYKASISYYSSGGVCYITVAYTMTYYTTAAQEAELTTALTSVLSSLDLDSKDEVEKICAIYQYICANVTYDYTNLNDSSYMLKYTAYAALMNGTAVCQGYSLLFYRMALEAGLDARIISGTRTSTGENHGWNIVQIGDYYYNLDSTWDANYSYGNYKYFLLCNANFSDHTRDDDYTTTSFYAAYPMSSSDYPCPYGHSYVSAVTAPTCTEQGYTTYTCSNCGDSYVSDYTDALGHTTEIQNAEDATCTEDGYTGDEVCTVCGETITTGEVIPATGHTTEVQNAKAATCTEDGYTGDEVCTVCGETVTAGEVIAATGHTWGEGVVTTEATCTEAGVMTYTCTVCGATKTEAIAATGHTAGEAVIENEVAATCTEDGSYDSVVYCTVCGEELSRETVTVSATGHNYVGVVTAPTCTKGGYTTYTCSVCGDSYVADETEATGHTWDEGKVTTEATCTTDGVMTYTCTACGETKTEAIAATGHTAGEAVTENEVAATCTE
ncbi:MAG: hypothetical protein LJU34_01705, partial [Oscillospiraceae bacterium]|nr:hypothetical protein [Oscillospiraceae bacterium]